MKKSYLYLVFLTSVCLSCNSGGADDDNESNLVNTAPTIPEQIYPLSNTLCIDNNVIFEWNASTDNEGNTITYRVEVSEQSDFSSLAYDVSSSSTSRVISLEKGKSYYWRLKSRDSKGEESAYSTVSQFLTEGDGISNHLPFAPSLISPALDSEIDGTSTTLNWSASDIDGDSLIFDVYLDTNANPITKVSENQSGTSYNASSLIVSTKYYFKVVVKDDKGGVSVGQVWSFTTK
ncbi:glycoside hydrolase family 78 protein [Hyunsoonleella pacifica]|uniref:Fibronectin type-III domain-containing protein n=1 Tax=Hyunsoonleella pacifica TaxID=1080224 RepID=A0A4Q9FJE1_9FLAO|nr:fibronectin type III domain-containing protein [Hyunsoonleella pacifica]TBN13071.1 hypothetical protein EYD46_16345 [Hyunsoonleella pacifica]GGD27367.1 hypothetical protein GCM10011368_31760 [Hyunsoonleella pacifica]